MIDLLHLPPAAASRPGLYLVHLVLLLALLSLTACEQPDRTTTSFSTTAGSRLADVRVDRIKDGDSFVANHHGRRFEVRLFGIDAPEREQGYARESKAMASELLEGRNLQLTVKDVDRYGRTVAVVFTTGSDASVNRRLIEQGAAWVYRQYTDDADWLAAEAVAKEQRHGLWRLPPDQRIEPWLWRKNNAKIK